MGQEEETLDRGNWSGKLDFLLSAIGYAVGLGNVWRFPYLAYRNGGASFLLPYIIMLIISGIPLFFIELALGQFSSEGPITCWRMAPFFTGIGYAMVIISGVVSIYYNVIIAYAIYYMFVSFVHLDEDVPWTDCEEPWKTDKCRSEPLPKLNDIYKKNQNATEVERLLYSDLLDKDCVTQLFNESSYSDYKDTMMSKKYDTFMTRLQTQFSNSFTFENITWKELYDYDEGKEIKGCRLVHRSPSEDFFQQYVLQQQKSDDLGDLGDISLKLILTLFLAWLLIFACLMKGIKTSGKVVYFTATFPYVILVVLLVRGVTLDGHLDGIKFYVIPEWEKLSEAKIWGDAATQIFYSLGIGFGGLLTMASYNKFHNNCYRDAILVAIINCGTSIFAGFAIFSLLGHMAYVTNQDVEDVASSGPGLAFVAYPDGISKLPASSLWAFLFFFMILTLGMDSQFAMMETVISGITDIFPAFLRKYKTPFTFLCCTIGFLLGIPQTTHGGIRVLTLMNDYSGSYNLMIVALFEIICLCYVYGLNNFRSDIELMLGFKPMYYWIATWMVITPIAVVFIVILSAIQYEPSGYGGQQFPGWGEGIGWVMVCVPIAAILVVGLIQFIRFGMNAFKPSKDWGPALPEHRIGRYAAINRGFENDGGELPFKGDASDPPPFYNGSNGNSEKYIISEKL